MTASAPFPAQVAAKWRPNLSLIVFLMLTAVLALPLVGLFFFRIYENQLVHQTEAELIAQSVALSAAIRRDFESNLPADAALGAHVPATPSSSADEPFRPILPSLDLTRDNLLGRRPDAKPAPEPAGATFKAAGERLSPLLLDTQTITLAGFRLLDPHGVVIAGRDEIGLSLAHVEEVAKALQGSFAATLRQRVSSHAPPPLYSLSRGTSIRIFTATPIILGDRVAGVLYASRTPSNVFRHLYEERGKVVLAGLSVAALTLLIGLAFHRTITRPVHELIARTTAIGHGDRSAMRPLTNHGTAEFARLSQSFLDMAGSLNNRSDFIATFAAHVSHELKSPLTSIEGAAELLRDDGAGDGPAMSEAKRRHFLGNIIADTHRLTAITNRLRELARAESTPTGGTTSLSPAIADLQRDFPGIRIRAEGALDSAIRISAENLRIILSHLTDNALRHGASELDIVAATEADRLCLTLRDNGSGVSPNNRARIFDSFFTTRRDSGGTGMGLSIVRAMLNAHGGAIALLDDEPGTTFALAFQRAPGAETHVETNVSETSESETGLRSRGMMIALCLATIAAGLLLRRFGMGLGLPFGVVKYGGSLLWGTMVYLLLTIIARRQPASRLAILAALIALCVELSRLYHTPWLDAFRLTTPGALLLGRVFSPWNLAAYGAGIALGWATDRLIARARL